VCVCVCVCVCAFVCVHAKDTSADQPAVTRLACVQCQKGNRRVKMYV